MKKALMVGLAIGLIGVSGATAAGKAGTKVTLDHIQVTPGGTIYTGDISSKKKGCMNKRPVSVYRVMDGKDQKRGTTKAYKGISQPGYYWSLDEDGFPPAGDYYAKVRATDSCKGARSATYRYPQSM